MPSTDWNSERLSDAQWLKAQTARKAPRFGTCMFCRRDKCGCGTDDPFGPHRDRVKPKDPRQPFLQIIPRDTMADSAL